MREERGVRGVKREERVVRNEWGRGVRLGGCGIMACQAKSEIKREWRAANPFPLVPSAVIPAKAGIQRSEAKFAN